MAKVSSALMEKLRGQMKSMRSGILIDNKTFTKMRLRLLPTFEDLPGKEYVSLYYVQGQKSTTSPQTYGLPDPVIDLMDAARNAQSKEEQEAINSVARIQREFWLPCFDRADPGTPESLNLRIHRSKRTVYQAIVNYMIDEEDEDGGDDITDPVEGRDIRIKKTGEKLNTEWSVKFLDREPIHDDPEMVEALLKAAKNFDVSRYFFKFDLDVLKEIYLHLTGEPIPDKYLSALSQIPKLTGKTTSAGSDDDDDDTPDDEGDEAATASDDEGDDTPDEPEASEQEDGEADFSVDDEVSFEHEGTTYVGKITGTGTDTDGDAVADVATQIDGEDVTCTVTLDMLTKIEPEPEPEPEPAPKKVSIKPKKTAGTKVKPKAGKTAVKKGSAASKLKQKIAGKK